MGDGMKLSIPRTVTFLVFASSTSSQRLLLRFLRFALSTAQVPVCTPLAGCPTFFFITSVI